VLKLKSLENHWAEILCGRSEFKLMGRAHDDFPELPDPKDLEFTDVDGAELIDLIQRTQFAVSPDEARINLNGVLLECDGDNATMVATDGHRLTKYTRAFAGPRLETGVIIPRKGMLEVRRLLERVTGDTAMAVGGGHLFVRADELLLSVKLTDVTFPPYREVIPGAHERRAYVDRQEFQSALRRAEVVAPEKTATVRLRLEAGVMELTADNPDLGVARQEIAVEYDSSELVAGFNARYLMDVLEVIETEEVQLDFQGELDPCVLRPRDGPDYLGVVMPMRI
jgi:DNA polymerase-3 subunit beta